MSSELPLQHSTQDGRLTVTAVGSWTAVQADVLEPLVQGVEREPRNLSLTLDLSGVQEVDTFGACLLDRLIHGTRGANASEANARQAHVIGAPQRGEELINEVLLLKPRTPSSAPRTNTPFAALKAAIESLGRATFGVFEGVFAFLAMLGGLADALIRALIRPRTFRLTSFVHQLDRVGLQAVPIVALITFLIGAIIAQQSLFSFRKFGADTYVVDLLAFLVLRELGVLIVAIMVAGRSGSSYTAEIGSMKMREEIDALRTMGLKPLDVLLLPRILALMIALPLLTFLGFLAALYGGGLVTWIYGGMSPAIFIERLREAISMTQLEVGMIKAPFMALAIGVVSCTEGLAVKGSAESLGLRTTASVVKSIFCIILFDGLLDLFFAAVGM